MNDFKPIAISYLGTAPERSWNDLSVMFNGYAVTSQLKECDDLIQRTWSVYCEFPGFSIDKQIQHFPDHVLSD